MANSYSQIYLHLVFAVKYRKAMIPLSRVEEVYKFMAAVINNHKKCQAIKIGGTSDHVHIFLRMNTTNDISTLVKDVKVATTNFINEKGIANYYNFQWQEGYGVFSISPNHTDGLVSYIENQIQHHMGVSFHDEYVRILQRYGIDYDERYIFSSPV